MTVRRRELISSTVRELDGTPVSGQIPQTFLAEFTSMEKVGDWEFRDSRGCRHR